MVSATTAASESILVAGIGNVFLGDDAFGVRVVERLAARTLPAHVRVQDFGIRGLDLAYALLAPHRAAILIDAAPRGLPAGTLHVLEVEADGSPELDTHAIDPVNVLRLAAALGGTPGRTLVVGCEPASIEVDGLSPSVAASVEPACDLILEVIERIHA